MSDAAPSTTAPAKKKETMADHLARSTRRWILFYIVFFGGPLAAFFVPGLPDDLRQMLALGGFGLGIGYGFWILSLRPKYQSSDL